MWLTLSKQDNRRKATILDRIKWEMEAPLPQFNDVPMLQRKRAIFSIIEIGGWVVLMFHSFCPRLLVLLRQTSETWSFLRLCLQASTFPLERVKRARAYKRNVSGRGTLLPGTELRPVSFNKRQQNEEAFFQKATYIQGILTKIHSQKFCEHEQASTLLIFASNSSKGQILRAVSNSKGPSDTPSSLTPEAPSTRIRIFSKTEIFFSVCTSRPHVNSIFDHKYGGFWKRSPD